MNMDYFLRGIDRRTLLKILSFTGISGLIYPRKTISGLLKLTNSRVVVVEDETAVVLNRIEGSTVKVMVDSGIKELTQTDNTGEAWKSLFPNITTNSIIAIKVNCINSYLSTHTKVTNAVADGLKLMNFNGSFFPENNIIIFDRTTGELRDAGYDINTSDFGVRCFGTDYTGVGYTSQGYNVNGSNQRISKIITEMADYFINIGVLKNHTISGITLCMKNHYGTCSNPGWMHDNRCDPYIPALNDISLIKSKQCVNIIDAIYGIVSGGPYGVPQITPKKILMSQDIVAVDYMGAELLKENGCTTTNMASYIATAANSYQLGTNNPNEIDVINIVNPTTNVNPSPDETGKPDDYKLSQNYPNPFNSSTRIRFYLKESAEAQLTVFDINGRQVRSLINRSENSGWHEVDWDGINDLGNTVASGIYICQLKTGSFKKSIVMQLQK